MTRLILGIFAAALCMHALAYGQASAPQAATTIQANANLVVVDVVATDARHNPVHNLTAADFTVLENGHPQTIKTFEEHSPAEATAPLPAPPKLPPGTFTNYTATPASGALNILLLDALNTPMSAQVNVRNQMLKYLKEAHPGTRMAIFGLSTRLVLLQGFTSDPELLRTVLNGKKGLPKGSAIMNDAVNGDNPGADDPMMDTMEDVMGNDPNAAQVLANVQQFEAETQSFQLQLRAHYTLDAFNQLGRYLSGFPGRKNLIWFSGSFPVNILPDGDLQNPFAIVASSEDEFRETTELLSRSQVAVYPIDARGLMVQPMLNASNSGSRYAKNPSTFGKDQTKFFQQTADEHGTMQAVAEATGGEAYVNTNGLKEAVEKAAERGSHYYTLTYSPIDQKWDGKYRKIRVNGSRPGLTLAYRRGYFADDPNAPPRHGEPRIVPQGQAPAYSAMRTAMMRGGPDPTEIVLLASIRPAIAGTENEVAPGNRAGEKIKGPYRRYTVVFSVDARGLPCPATQDGVHHCTMDAVIVVYDADGALLNSSGNEIRANIPANQYASVLRAGLRFRQDISIPVKGETFLRIGVHDATTDKVGAIEVPVAALSKLPPLADAGTK